MWDVGIFGQIRDLINSTVNEPEFSLKNFWKRGGPDRVMREANMILIIVIIKILLKNQNVRSDIGIRALFVLSLFIGFLHLFMIVISICSHIKGGKDGWRWIKWNRFTGEICFEKYYPPIFAISYARPNSFYTNERPKGKNRRIRWERGLKWKMWYSFLNFIAHIIRGMFILLV